MENELRVYVINAIYGYGSTGRIVEQMKHIQSKQGVICRVATPFGIRNSQGYLCSNRLDQKVHAFFARLFCNEGSYSIVSTIQLLRDMKKFDPDIVHLHNLHSNYVNIYILLKYLAKNDIATVITLHDCWFYTGKCCHYTVDACTQWKKNCGNCLRLKKDIPSWFFDRTKTILRKKNELYHKMPRLAVVGVSDWITNEAKNSILKDARYIRRIYNWVDSDIFYPRTYNNAEYSALFGEFKKVILGVASDWIEAKGLSTFFALAKVLPEDTCIALVGRISTEIKLPTSIIRIGQVGNQVDLAKIYSMADVYISLSKEESFGLTTAEALSCGTPVIVMNSTASPELVGMNCGYVINSTEPQMIMEKVNMIFISDKDETSRDCRKFACENFDEYKNIGEYTTLYRIIARVNKSVRG